MVIPNELAPPVDSVSKAMPAVKMLGAVLVVPISASCSSSTLAALTRRMPSLVPVPVRWMRAQLAGVTVSLPVNGLQDVPP